MENSNRAQTTQSYPYRIWQRAISAFSCFAILLSTCGMILPARAEEQTLHCGLEEHQHTEGCYERRLVCDHKDEEPHVHTEACYQQERVRTCGLEENPGHVHDESCIGEVRTLICEDTSEDHVHDDSCYRVEKGYVCGKEAGEGAHTHGDACYEMQDVLVCKLHAHTEECQEDVLICGKEAHTHSLSCYSDPEADVESEADWEKSVSKVTLTGVWAEDVIAIAKSQLGYEESKRNYAVAQDGTVRGYTRYGEWYGDPYGSWGAMFVSFCLNYAGISRDSVPYESNLGDWIEALSGETWGLYRGMEDGTPRKGDIVFLDTNEDDSADQVGLVSSASGDSLKLIVGDRENSVQEVTLELDSGKLFGFAVLPENPERRAARAKAAAAANEAEGEELSITLGETLNVDVAAGETVKIPFVPEYTHEYIFQSTGSGDPHGYIYNTEGNQLAYNDDSGGNRQFQIAYTLAAGQTYYLWVKWRGSNISGTIPVLLTLGGHDFIQNESGQYECGCGETATASEGDLAITLDQSLLVDVMAEETVRIPFVPEITHEYIFQSVGTGNPYGYIYGADGSQLASDDNSGGNGQFKMAYTMTAGRTYYLGVRWYNSTDSGTIPVLLTLSDNHYFIRNESGQWECSCSETVAGDQEFITLGQTLNVYATGGIRKIPFVPKVTHEYVFQFKAPNSTYGYIYDADGKMLKSGYSGNGNITYSLTAGGIYYLGVMWYSSNQSGTIPLLLTLGNHSYTKDENGKYKCACGETMEAEAMAITLDTPLDVSVEAGETVAIPFVPTITHEYVFQSTGTGNPYGYIYDADGKLLQSNDNSGGNNQFKITRTLTAGETYCLGVKWNSSTGSGTIPLLLTLGSHSYAKDEDGQFVCTCGKTADGITLDVPLEVDVAKGEIVKIPFIPMITHGYSFKATSTGHPTDGYIYDADGKQLANGHGSAGMFQADYTLTAGQTYYLGVKWANFTDSGTIPVLLTYGTHSYAKNEVGILECSCGQTSIVLGQTADIPVEYGQTERLPFVPEFTHEYVFSNASYRESYVYLYDANGKILARSNYGSNSQITHTMAAGKTYYLGVGWNGGYSGARSVLLTLGSHSYAEDENGEYMCTCGATIVPEGQCGGSVYWRYENGTLRIFGSGKMYDYSTGSAPWQKLAGDIKRVVVEDGVTSIGSSAFYNCKSLTSVSIPGSVTNIGNYTFQRCGALTSVVILAGVTSIGSFAFSDCGSLRTAIIQEGVISIGSQAFYNCDSLTSVTIPGSVTSIGSQAFYCCDSLTSVTIPKSVTSVGSDVFSMCAQLDTLVWNAENASMGSSSLVRTRNLMLLVGKDVDTIGETTFANLEKLEPRTLRFEGPNYLTLPDIRTATLEQSLYSLAAGNYYVDPQGALYRLHDGEASLAYWPGSLTSCTIPAAVPGEDGTPIPVTGVDSHAFAAAKTLTAINFTAPGRITALADYAFADAAMLAGINGKTTEETILPIFSQAETGVQLFTNTAIGHENDITDGVLHLEAEHLDLKISTIGSSNHTPAMAEDHTFLYYTGETATTSVTISNPDSGEIPEGTIVRMIYKFDRAGATLNYQPGTYTLKALDTGNIYEMTVTEDPRTNCYTIDIERPREGDTLAVNFSAAYPSPGTAGGNADIWGGILTKEEVEAKGSALIAPTVGYHRVNWTTRPDTFPVTKTLTSSNSVTMKGDGENGAYLDGLNYTIRLSRQGETLEGMGKDFITRVDFRDVLTLPEGVELSQEFVQAIRAGNYAHTNVSSSTNESFSLDGNTFLTLSYGRTHDESASLEIDENDNLVLKWYSRNQNLSTEIGSPQFTYTLSGKYVRVPNPEPDKTYTVKNQITATEHYMYSVDRVETALCETAVKTSEGSLTFQKTRTDSSSHYFGENVTWRITARNPSALPYTRLSRIEDELPDDLYLTAEQLAALFEADPEHQLGVTISRASLCAPHTPQTVTGMDGVTTGSTSLSNTGSDTPYDGRATQDPDAAGSTTITLQWGEDGNLQIAFGEEDPVLCEADGATIQAVLDSHGFLVTQNTRYKLCWDRRDAERNTPPLGGGETIVKEIPCKVKDTFMKLNLDEKNRHPSTNYWQYNTAYAYEVSDPEHKERLTSDDDSVYLYRDFYLYKGMSRNGEAVEEGTTLRQGDAVTYSLRVQHSGSGRYDLLPLTDHMTGSQALLVPKEKNQTAPWAADCEIISLEDREYYLLAKDGTYSQVWTSDTQLADTVAVKKTGSGYDTLLKWYFTDYSGSRTDTVAYQAYVCPEKAAAGTIYHLDNETWLNDHATHRLYDVVGWWGTLIFSDKKIVDAVGDTGEGRVYSQVHERETVTYRLMLESYPEENGEPVELTLSGTSLYDALPMSLSAFRWSKENVQVFYQEESENYKVVNGDSWDIETTSGSDQQLLKWKEDFSITFRGKAYIYVTLDFPEGLAWQNYAARYGATTLVNTFHALNMESSVTHELAIPAKVRLQKGVYSTGYWHPDYSTYPSWTEGCRKYYNNDDAYARYVTYYVALYNSGKTNLYLTDMQDRLPQGFTLWSCNGQTTTGGYDSYSYGASGRVEIYQANGTLMNRYKNKLANISTSTRMEGKTQYVTFHFSKYDGNNYPVRYDETRGMCYLAPGEAIQFCYFCWTNQAADTEDKALNTISMPYYDYNGGGVEIDSAIRMEPYYNKQYGFNNGSCELWNNGQAENMGLTGGTTDTQWLVSQVTVERGGILPGLTKALTSKTDVNGVVTQNPVSALSTDTLNWTITAENDGTLAITDYVLTDVMQAPYDFSGNVNYEIYAPGGTSRIRFPYDGSLFKILPGLREGTFRVSYRTSSGTWMSVVTIGGMAVTIPVEVRYRNNASGVWLSIQIAFQRNEAGNLVMSLHFPKELAIPEYGKGVLTLSTKRDDAEIENRQFLNTAYITPVYQTWEGNPSKGNQTTLATPYTEGEMPSVRNSAPITTTYGYMTSSGNSISNGTSTASSTDDPNFIVLEQEEKDYTYTMWVENTTPLAMNKLVMITGLPDVGDHSAFLEDDPRFSEFKVSLAEDPNFTVTVKTKDGQVKTLSPEQYTITFSDKTEFGESDWDGSSQWAQSSESARSIRLQILDDAGTLIPAGSTVSLSIGCRVDDKADPGAAAWNSFGYHYGLVTQPYELEAAPPKVGIKTPTLPQLKKQVVDSEGQEAALEKDTTFSFLIYPGEPLTGSYDTVEALIQALKEKSIPSKQYDVTVKAGESISDAVRMKNPEWTWTKGQKYTVMELPHGYDYTFSRFEGANGTSNGSCYIFTYDPGRNQVLTCINIQENWTVALTKVNTSEEPLEGAVFALYSPSQKEQLPEIPEEYQNLDVETTLEQSGKTWYLKAVGTTGEDGKLAFSDLLQEEYYLLEVEAPFGYTAAGPEGQIVTWAEAEDGILERTVVNWRTLKLPKVGGIGTQGFFISGMILTLGAGILLIERYRRRFKKKAETE